MPGHAALGRPWHGRCMAAARMHQGRQRACPHGAAIAASVLCSRIGQVQTRQHPAPPRSTPGGGSQAQHSTAQHSTAACSPQDQGAPQAGVERSGVDQKVFGDVQRHLLKEPGQAGKRDGLYTPVHVYHTYIPRAAPPPLRQRIAGPGPERGAAPAPARRVQRRDGGARRGRWPEGRREGGVWRTWGRCSNPPQCCCTYETRTCATNHLRCGWGGKGGVGRRESVMGGGGSSRGCRGSGRKGGRCSGGGLVQGQRRRPQRQDTRGSAGCGCAAAAVRRSRDAVAATLTGGKAPHSLPACLLTRNVCHVAKLVAGEQRVNHAGALPVGHVDVVLPGRKGVGVGMSQPAAGCSSAPCVSVLVCSRPLAPPPPPCVSRALNTRKNVPVAQHPAR